PAVWDSRAPMRAAAAPTSQQRRRRDAEIRGAEVSWRDLWVHALAPFEADERAHRHVELAQLGRAAEVGQVDDEASGEHLRAQLAQQLDRALGRAAGGDQVVDQNDAVALLGRVLV